MGIWLHTHTVTTTDASTDFERLKSYLIKRANHATML